jgi:hypothetical protein
MFTLLLLTLASSLIGLVQAQDTEIKTWNLETDDSNFLFNPGTASVGSKFNATFWVENVTDLFAFQVYVDCNDSLLNITNAWLPTTHEAWIFTGKTTVQPVPAFYDLDENNYTEAVKVGDSMLLGDPVNGSGILAIVEFEIIYVPDTGSVSCDLVIDYIDTFLLNFDLDEIDVAKNGGYYEFSAVAPDETPPDIHEVYQEPTSDMVYPEDMVDVYANVTDDDSGVKQVILNYTTNNGTWFTADMINLSGSIYNATIPAFPLDTDVTYIVMAEDNANNTITTEELGWTYQYNVIPEIAYAATLVIFVVMITLAAVFARRKITKVTLSKSFHK